jgi:fructokinase
VILVCGETLIDLVHVDGELWRALPGGSPANTAVALARLSTSTAMLARISSDAFGVLLRDRLVGDGVDVRYVVAAAEQSSMAVVDIGHNGSARYSFYLRETADWQWVTSDLPVAFDPSVTALHAGSMALLMPPGGVVLEAMLERERSQRVVSIDPNVRASICPDPRLYRETVERWLRLAHIVKASVDDVNWLYPDRSYADVLADWSTRGPSLVVFTRSADGALARLPSGLEIGVGGIDVEVVDTIGAGDTFTAGLLHALDEAGSLSVSALAQLTAEQVEEALRLAVLVSAVACTRAGADPPYLTDLPAIGH